MGFQRRKLLSIFIVLSAVVMLTNFVSADMTPATSDKVQMPGDTIISPDGTEIYSDPDIFDGLITQDFFADVGRDADGNLLPMESTYWDGTDIFSDGVDMDFSSPDAPDPTLVTVNSAYPELGPVGPNNEFWCGALRYDFDIDVVAVGFSTHLLGPVQIILLNRDSNQISSTTWDAGGGMGFVGIIDDRGFASVILDTDNCFWSMGEVRGQKAVGPGSGSINGTVTDANTGDPIDGARVIAINPQTKAKVTTDSDGYYEIPDLEPGKYWVICVARGYKLGITKADVAAGPPTIVDFPLVSR